MPTKNKQLFYCQKGCTPKKNTIIMLQLYPPIIATSLQWLFPSGPRVAIVERFHCSSVSYGSPITGIPSQLFVIGYPHDPHTN